MLLTIRVDRDLKQQIAALSANNSEFATKVSQIVRSNALNVVENAKALVPISTGALRRSILPTFLANGFAAIIGSSLPYAARQEFDETLDHSVRQARVRKINTKSGAIGSVIKGTAQFNPDATFGFLRKSLAVVGPFFLADLQALCDKFGRAWTDGEL